MKWGSLYDAEYVNVLYRAVTSNTCAAPRFVCLTDDRTGILPEIDCFDIPEIGCSREMLKNGAWPKLSVFRKDLYDIKGRCLFIDLDTVIWGNIDCFWENKEPLTVIDTGSRWRPNGRNELAEPLVGTGVFAFNSDSLSHLQEEFTKDPFTAFRDYKIEQVWVQNNAKEISYWPRGWVISFKRWLRQPLGLDVFLQPKLPSEDVKIIAFHGVPRPIDLIKPKRLFWDRFPHLGHGRVPWMQEYWMKYGGSI